MYKIRKNRRIIALAMAFMMMFTFMAMTSSAATVDISEVHPEYIASCPGGDKHLMCPSGSAFVSTGTVYSPGSLLHFGHINICSNCGEVLWSLDQPNLTYTLSKYYITNRSALTSDPYHGTVIFIGSASNLGTFNGSVLQDSYWQGYEFLNPL